MSEEVESGQQRTKLGLINRIAAFFNPQRPDSAGLRRWFSGMINDLEERRVQLLNSMQTLTEEVENEGAEAKLEIKKYLGGEELRIRADLDSSIKLFSVKSTSMMTAAEKDYKKFMQSEGRRFRENLASDLDRIETSAAEDLSVWGSSRAEEVRARLKEVMNTAEQSFQTALTEAEDMLKEKINAKLEDIHQRQQQELEQQLESFKSLLAAQVGKLVASWPTKINELNETARKIAETDRDQLLEQVHRLEKEAADAVAEFGKSIEDAQNSNASVSASKDQLTEQAHRLEKEASDAIAEFRKSIENVTNRSMSVSADSVKQLTSKAQHLEKETQRLEKEAAEAVAEFGRGVEKVRKKSAAVTDEAVQQLTDEVQARLTPLREEIVAKATEELQALQEQIGSDFKSLTEELVNLKSDCRTSLEAAKKKFDQRLAALEKALEDTGMEDTDRIEELRSQAKIAGDEIRRRLREAQSQITPVPNAATGDGVNGVEDDAQKNGEGKMTENEKEAQPSRQSVLATLKRHPWMIVDDPVIGEVQVLVTDWVDGSKKLYCGRCDPTPKCSHVMKAEAFLAKAGIQV
jgi:DNA repair exonuclease SbcCD ATPase subunit